MHTRPIFWLMLALLVLLAGCTGTDNTAVPVPVPATETVTCHVAYRSGPGQPFAEQAFSLDAPGEARRDFADLSLTALYSRGEGEGGRALALRVTRPDSPDPLAAQLYQFAPGQTPRNEFVGGHGFTGLAYVYQPGGAELQYWCVAGRE